MPIEDALLLITRNFDAYMRGEKIHFKNNSKITLTDRHPETMQMIINLLAENRMLSVAQYDKIITYLDEKRSLQQEHDGVEKAPEPPVDGKAAELQNRILNILNKNTEDTPKPAAPPATPLLNDPSVQKALDSLLIGDLLKNMAN